MAFKNVLIVDDEEGMRHFLEVLLNRQGYRAVSVEDGSVALKKLEKEQCDLVLMDIRMPKMDGLECLDRMIAMNRSITVIMMSAYGDINTAVEAMKRGAYDYISKPFKSDEILLTIKKAEERNDLLRENVALKKVVERQMTGFDAIIASNEKMTHIFEIIKKIARYKTSVLVYGESGTGKELIAKAIHTNSDRVDKPFIPINCGAIPETLLESELFGHVKGSFTGAVEDKPGLFEEATTGTLFLDEIGELPLQLQVKLLRALQEEEIRRVGGNKVIKIDVRIIAATVKDLEIEVKNGHFREDLYYRLNVFTIRVPSLSERRDDIPKLVEHFIEKFNARLNKKIRGVTPEAMAKLLDYRWRGNVRELENTIERAMVLAERDKLMLSDLPAGITAAPATTSNLLIGDDLSIKKSTIVLEKELIIRALKKTKGNKTRAAKILEISHRALLYKLKEYDLEKNFGKEEKV
jgi:two-component system, NtrC family, response regulator AtoC